MGFKRHLALGLSTCLTLANLAAAQFTIPTREGAFQKDIYPDREQTIETAATLCKILQPLKILSPEDVKNIVEKNFLQNAGSVGVTYDDHGWTARTSFEEDSGGLLKIIKNGTFFTFSYLQDETKIESIASISFSDDCQKLSDARFTYYNSARRPIRKVKLNSERQVLYSVVMEEPIKNADQGDVMSLGKVRIGIIDSGIDYNHPKIVSKSRPMLGIDLTDLSRPPFDYTNSAFNELGGKHFSHGTAVSDIASRDVDALIVPVRIENRSSLASRAVEYLARQGVHLVNISQGTQKLEDWLPLKEAIQKHPEILFIVSAGNDSHDIGAQPHYPASFALPNMLVVAATDHEGQLSSISNYSSRYVQVAALGDRVEAALAGGGNWTVSGTSFAAPLVTNIAAKILQENPKLTTQELRALLIKKAKPSSKLVGKVQYGILELE